MSWTTNHNKAAVGGLFSQPIKAYVDHIVWQLLVASVDHVAVTISEGMKVLFLLINTINCRQTAKWIDSPFDSAVDLDNHHQMKILRSFG